MQRGIANDNDPYFYDRSQERHGYAPLFGQNRPAQQDRSASSSRRIDPSDDKTKTVPLLTPFLWLGSIVLFTYLLFNPATIEIRTLSALAVVWTGFWAKYIYGDANSWRIAELAVLSILAGFAGLTWISATALNIAISIPDAAMILSGLSAVLALLIKSRIVILSSIAASLIWFALFLADIAPVTYLMSAIIPLTIIQLAAATRLKSEPTILAGVLVAYAWMAGLLSNMIGAQTLPLIFCASIAFSLGFAQLRIGKSMADMDVKGHNVHTYVGWLTAMAAAVLFQRVWLSDDGVNLINQLPSQTGFMTWKIATLACFVAVFTSGIIRYKYTKITLIGIFLLSVASALIPLVIWFPNIYDSLLQTIPGLSVVPATGIFMGGAITAIAIGSALNGVRRNAPLMMVLGLFMLAVQGAFLFNPVLFTADNIMVFLAGFCGAIATGGIIAGSSLAFMTPAPRTV